MWAEFQASVEDSLEAVRVRNRKLEGQIELLNMKIDWEKEKQPNWIEQWMLPLAVTAGIVVGAFATR